MGILNLVLLLGGMALIVAGGARARGPWRRYQAMRDRQDNLARYESWRGGVRGAPDEKTGASVMLEELRRQTRIWGAVIGAGVVLVVLAFTLR
jgi:hypothetical protein